MSKVKSHLEKKTLSKGEEEEHRARLKQITQGLNGSRPTEQEIAEIKKLNGLLKKLKKKDSKKKNPKNPNSTKKKPNSTKKKPKKKWTFELDKALVKLLRHTSAKHGLSMREDGSVLLRDILALEIMQNNNVTKNQVVEVVNTCPKQRLKLFTDKDGKEYIKATQGHTTKSVKSDAALERVTNLAMLGPCLVHGTNEEAWEQIFRSDGLNRMKRIHIHIAMGLPGAAGVISGMRSSSDVHIFLDGKKMLEDGVKLYKSSNGVILCEGDSNGYLSKKYFSKVVTSDGKLLFKDGKPVPESQDE